MPRAHQQGGEPSHRVLRVAELIRHTVSDLLTRAAINDPELEGRVITIPDVRMSPDLKLATVYVLPLGGKDVAGVVAALERHKKFVRAEIARNVNLKFAPEVRFKADQSFEASAKINALFEKPEVKRDLDGKKDEAE
ncbi:30S ribosome-binding factor RbfA [Methyloferula stellata]|uniref:30S ribosome-binding factor RbfA n=1 Tax=Methyloferula stellata TaxID=876270 RepID=UPI00047CE699|nr:30S ribosome-binding factor RbfA [Methyloferula stellata]